jgi:hypothetical protein
VLAGCQGALQAGNRRRLRSHALRDLRLRESSVMPCLQKLIKEFSFLALNPFDLLFHSGPAKQL